MLRHQSLQAWSDEHEHPKPHRQTDPPSSWSESRESESDRHSEWTCTELVPSLIRMTVRWQHQSPWWSYTFPTGGKGRLGTSEHVITWWDASGWQPSTSLVIPNQLAALDAQLSFHYWMKRILLPLEPPIISPHSTTLPTHLHPHNLSLWHLATHSFLY